MKDNFEHSLETTKQIMENVIPSFEIKGDPNQLKTQIHPIISNAMYHRDKDIREVERFRTIIELSRVLDDANIGKAKGFRV